MSMTVKHEKSDGNSKLYEVESLEYEHLPIPSVMLRTADGAHKLTGAGGRVFVMNASGATVAKYVL
jgi:hypothetical protein